MSTERPDCTFIDDAYRFEWADQRVRMELERFHETRDDIRCELTVTSTDPVAPGRLFSGRLLLIGPNSLRDCSRLLMEREPQIDWGVMLAQARDLARDRYRSGDPIIDLRRVERTDRPRYLVAPVVYAGAAISMLYGLGETAKSLTALAFGVAVASGEPVFMWEPTDSGPVVYLDWEDDPETHAERLRAIARGAGIDAETAPIYYQRMALSLSSAARDVRKKVSELGARLVIVDSLGLACGGDPQDASVMIETLIAARSLNVPVLVIHHMSKTEKDKKNAYGSVYGRNEVRLAWHVEGEVDRANGTTTIRNMYTNTKANRGATRHAMRLVATPGRQLWICVEGEGCVFKGRIDDAETQVDSDGGATLVLSGLSIAANLRDASTLAGNAYSAQSLSTVTSGLLTGTGWSSGTLDSPSTNFSGRFDYVSIWSALQRVAETFHLLLREDNANEEIDISAFNTASGVRLISPEAVSPNLRDNANAIPITGIRKNSSSMDVVNKVIPIGQRTGINAANFDLADSDRTTPYTIQSDTGPDGETYYYIEDSTSQTAYGTRTRAIHVKDVLPEGLTDADFTRAANALYDRAVTYLQRHKDPLVSYDVGFVGLKHYVSGSPTVQPGDSVYCGFRGMTEDANGKRLYLDVGDDLYVMAMSRSFNADGSDTWRMTLSTVPRHVPTDGNVTAELMDEVRSLQGAPLPFVLFGDNIMRMDTNGIQMQTEGNEGRSVYWVDTYESDLGTLPDAVTSLSGFANTQIVAAYGKWQSYINNGDQEGTLVEISSGSFPYLYARVYDDAGVSGSPTNPAFIEVGHPNGGSISGVSVPSGESYIILGADNIFDKDGKKVGGMSLIVKGADESVTSSTTLQDDDDLTFAVGANEEWQFEGVLFVDSATDPDFKYTFAGPTGAVGSFDDGDRLGDVIAFTSFSWPNAISFRGAIATGGTAGNLTLRWAQNTSNGTSTTVQAGSYIKYQSA